jgi:hypothetical protein
MPEPIGKTRLDALPAPDVWHARTGLTLYTVTPYCSVTVALSVAGLSPGDIAGLAIFIRPYAWLGVECAHDGMTVSQFNERSGHTSRIPLTRDHLWLRADCDVIRGRVTFHYSLDGLSYSGIGEPYLLGDGRGATSGIPCSLFSCATARLGEGGWAEFHSFLANTESAPRADD